MQTELLTRYFSQPKQVFWFNDNFQIDASDQEQNNNVLVTGKSGEGKTILISGYCMQVGNGLLLDTKGRSETAIISVGLSGWEFFDCETKRLQINASELQLSSVNVLVSGDSQSEMAAFQCFRHFCLQPKHKKTFASLMIYLKDFPALADDLALIFHKNDNGLTLGDLIKKRICWVTKKLHSHHRAPGLLIKMLFDYSDEHPLKNPIFLGVDDAQIAATRTTVLGRAFATSFSESRAFRIITVLGSTHDSYLDFGIKVNPGISFYMFSKAEGRKLKNKGIDFSDYRFSALRRVHPKGTCFVDTNATCIVSGKRVSLDSPFPIYFDIYGLIARQRKRFKKGDCIPIKQDFFG